LAGFYAGGILGCGHIHPSKGSINRLIPANTPILATIVAVRAVPLKAFIFLAPFVMIAFLAGPSVAAGTDRNFELLDAAYKGQRSRIITLLKAGAAIETRDAYGYTPLMWAAQEGRPITVELLISLGANVNVKDKKGRTPLLVAVARGHQLVTGILLKNGADPTLETNDKISPIRYAQTYGRRRIRTLLQEHLRARLESAPKTAQTQPTPVAPETSPKPSSPSATKAINPETSPKPSSPSANKAINPETSPKPSSPSANKAINPETSPKPGSPSATKAVNPEASPKPGSRGLGVSADGAVTLGEWRRRFSEHVGARNPEQLIEVGFDSQLEDQLELIFVMLEGAESNPVRMREVRAMIKRAQIAIGTQSGDPICRQIINGLDVIAKERLP
jgi:hypothetical protein